MGQELLDSLHQITIPEIIATLSFIIYVILATREHPLCWPVSMLGVAIMMYISFQAKLYADVVLNIFYFVISIFGMYNWIRGGGNSRPLPVSWSSKKLIFILIVIALAGTGITGWALDEFTDTDVPYWDALTTVLSFIGAYLLARKKIENWLVWIVTDAIYIGLYFYKSYPLLSMLNVFYVIISFFGLALWYKSLRKTRSATL